MFARWRTVSSSPLVPPITTHRSLTPSSCQSLTLLANARLEISLPRSSSAMICEPAGQCATSSSPSLRFKVSPVRVLFFFDFADIKGPGNAFGKMIDQHLFGAGP